MYLIHGEMFYKYGEMDTISFKHMSKNKASLKLRLFSIDRALVEEGLFFGAATEVWLRKGRNFHFSRIC